MSAPDGRVRQLQGHIKTGGIAPPPPLRYSPSIVRVGVNMHHRWEEGGQVGGRGACKCATQ